MSPKTLTKAISLLAALSLIAASCTTPTPQPTAQPIKVTRIVEGTPQVVVVTPTPGAEVAPPTGQLPAAGLIACRPLPNIGAASGVRLAKYAAPEVFAPVAPVRAPSAAAVQSQEGERVYRVGVFEDVTALNFWVANGPDNTIWNAYLLPPRLTMYTLSDVRFDFYPVLALALPEPLQQEGDKWVGVIPIRQDVQWSDGKPLTAKDVAFTANTVLRFGLISGNWQLWYDGNFLERVEAVDDYTVKYVFHTKPGLARYQYGVLQAPILAEHFWTAPADEAAQPITALGANPTTEALTAARQEAQDNLFAVEPNGEPLAGSFLFNKREPGAFIEETANPNYLERGATVIAFANGAYQEIQADIHDFTLYGEPQGEVALQLETGPHVEAAVYSVYGSQDAAILALQSGEIDFVLNSLGLQKGLLDKVTDDPNLSIISNSPNGFRYLSFNNRRRPMNDCAFRQAVAALIDKEFVANTVLQRVAFPSYTYVPSGNGFWYFDDVPKIGAGLDRSQRLELAIAILEQAGYTWEGGQKPVWDAETEMVVTGGRLIMPDGVAMPDLELWAPNAGYDPLRSTFAIWIESWLKEAGIPVTAKLAGFNALIPRIFTEQDFDMYILGWSLDMFPAHLRDYFHSEQAVPDGNNAGGYINPEYDQLANQLLACDNFDACKALANELQQILATETPYVVLFDTAILEAYRSASIEFPYTQALDGLQGAQGNNLGPRGIEVFVKIRAPK